MNQFIHVSYCTSQIVSRNFAKEQRVSIGSTNVFQEKRGEEQP